MWDVTGLVMKKNTMMTSIRPLIGLSPESATHARRIESTELVEHFVCDPADPRARDAAGVAGALRPGRHTAVPPQEVKYDQRDT